MRSAEKNYAGVRDPYRFTESKTQAAPRLLKRRDEDLSRPCIKQTEADEKIFRKIPLGFDLKGRRAADGCVVLDTKV